MISCAFLFKNGKKWHGKSDFFQNFNLHIFYCDKIPIFRKKLAVPSGGQWWKKIFLLEVCSQVSKTLLYFPDNFFNSLWLFQTNSVLLWFRTLEFEEFCQLSAKFLVDEDPEVMKKELKEAFRIYDKAGNGYIPVSALKAMMNSLHCNEL